MELEHIDGAVASYDDAATASLLRASDLALNFSSPVARPSNAICTIKSSGSGYK